MRIFTYPNPFEINKNEELWSIVTKFPHYCASDTLVQGLEFEYGRKSFGILRTVNSLIERVLGSYTNNPQNDIQMFLAVSNIIRSLKDAETKAAFRFNIADVVESMKFLSILGCDSSMFDHRELSDEQVMLLDIYEKVLQSGCIELLESLKQLNKSDYIIAARSTINDEIAYLCNRTPKYMQLGITLPIVTPKDGYEAIHIIIEYLNKKIKQAPNDVFSPLPHSDDLDRANYILSLITNNDDSIFDRIIIHGVHRITPEMYFLFKLLENIGIEVIFLINYAENLPNVYKTWKEVYSWCDTKFEYQSELNISSGKKLGVAIAGIIEGKKLAIHPTEEVTVFRNLTSFTDREVRQVFKKSGENLNKMRTQYYAVRGESSNEILKMYFPEQFNQKPFLSYPIGQFILGIYQMWDFEKNTLILNDKSLSECAVSNLYKGYGLSNVFEIISKTKLYFSNIETITDYYKRSRELERALQIISSNNRYSPLKKLSFFSITLTELSEFRAFLEFLEDVANKLFKDVNPTVDFGKHFKTLMEIISIPSLSSITLSKTEQELISEITSKLNAYGEKEVIGNIEDVKEAISFFLSERKTGDTSNWIVRDFSQIDGGVLLSRKSKATNYHFACLSNVQMLKQPDDILPWPLTLDMFNGYKEAQSAVPIVNRGLLEMRNFLKYTLFYGAFFTKCEVKLSYIQEENGEEQMPYYLLNVLGLKQHIYYEDETTSFLTDEEADFSRRSFSSGKLEQEAKEMFSICPYKFLQNEVLKAPIEYYSDYHIKYYVSNFMYAFIKGRHNIQRESLEQVITAEFKAVRKLFPFWDKVVVLDIERNTRKQLEDLLSRQESGRHQNIFFELTYERRKENYLIAQWVDARTREKQMNFDKDGLSESISNYMGSNQLYPRRDELPHKKVCENCNFSGVCLRDYYEAFAQIERDK